MRGRSLNRHTKHSQHVQQIVHADGQVTTHQQDVVSYPVKPSADMQRKRLLLILGIIALAVIGVFSIRAFVDRGVKDQPVTNTADTSVTNQLVSESLDQLATENPTGLAGTVEKINATPGNDTDPSLIYIKLRYYIAIGDYVNARSSYDALVKVYNPETGYNALIGQSARSLDGLKADVEFLEQQAQQIEKNAWGSDTQ